MDTHNTDSQQTAEYAMALDLSSQLTLVLDEEMVLQRIVEIFEALFAPQRLVFHVMSNGSVIKTLTYPKSRNVTGPLDLQRDLPETTPAGFRLRIPYKDETIGIIEVDGLAFPEYRERYLSLALAVAGVCGLAAANARTHNHLEAALSDLRTEHALSLRLSGELQVINEHLEDRVRERTAELENATRHLEEEVKQRRAAEEVVRSQLDEKTILLRELHHRVKNNLQLIASMLSIQSRKVTDPPLALALSESRNRIRTMSLIHEKLWAAQDLSKIDLDALVRQIPSNILSLYRIAPGTVSISMNITRVSVDINTAIPLGLVLNELFSNALKHAFPDGRTGKIVLTIQDVNDGLLVRFADNGIGMPQGYDWENPDTVGLILINSLVQQMQGTIEKESGAGTRFLIRLPEVAGASVTMRGTYNTIPG